MPPEAEVSQSSNSELVELSPACRNIAVYQENLQAEFLSLHAETESLLRQLQSLSRRPEAALKQHH